MYKYNGMEFSYEQIKYIRDITDIVGDKCKYLKPEFSPKQIQLICKGLRKRLNVSYYAKECFSEEQMEAIYEAALNGCPLWKVSKPGMSVSDIKTLAKAHVDNVDMTPYMNDKYSPKKRILIEKGLANWLDMSFIVNPKFNYDQMRILYNCRKLGLPEYIFAKPKYNYGKMYLIAVCIGCGRNYFPYLKQSLKINKAIRIANQIIEESGKECVILKNLLS